MFESVVQHVGSSNLNVQVPVGYLVAALAVAWGGWVIAKKAIGLAFLVGSRLTFGLVGSSMLLLSGLGGMGYSFGDLLSWKSKEPDKVENLILTRTQLEEMAKNGKEEQVKAVLDFVKERDRVLLRDNQYTVMAGGLEPTPPTPPRQLGTPWSLMGLSLGSLIVGVAWALRRFDMEDKKPEIRKVN